MNARRLKGRRQRSDGPVRRYRPHLEILEDRSQPSVLTFTSPVGNGLDDMVLRRNVAGDKLQLFDNGVLVAQQNVTGLTAVQITGAAGEVDRLTLDYGNGLFSFPVSFNGGTGSGDRVSVSANANFTLTNSLLSASVGSSVTLTGVEEAHLTGGAANNILDATAFSGTTRLDGGLGNDTLRGGAGVDEMFGGPGNDTLISVTGGNDVIQGGGLGNDTYILDPGSTITVIDDGGDDTINLSPITNPVVVVVGAGTATVTEGPGSGITVTGDIETWIGTAQADTFVDPPAAVLTFIGGLGDDQYVLDLGLGSMINVIEEGGDDTIDLSLVTSGGATVVLGNTSGTANVPANNGQVTITGTMENVIGTSFNDSITGNSFDNTLDGGPGSDTVSGGEGNDTYVVEPGGTETLIESTGADTIDFSGAAGGITINLASSGPQVIDAAGNRVLLVGLFENVIGTNFADVINGNSTSNVLVGGGGDDRLSGHSGRDILFGGPGADRLMGGPDDDILHGGISAFDSNVEALTAIQAEWNSARDYATRIANLRGTGSGQSFDDRLNNGFFLKVSGPDRTMFDDGAADTISGSQNNDWFFLGALDVITDQTGNEEVDQVSPP
jgi:Ca2+-binding RTX toxin-like protein